MLARFEKVLEKRLNCFGNSRRSPGIICQ